jgi:sec-independent protein translocase protein TatA
MGVAWGGLRRFGSATHPTRPSSFALALAAELCSVRTVAGGIGHPPRVPIWDRVAFARPGHGWYRQQRSYSMGLGTGEIILIALVIMVVFGASRLPQLGDGLGRAIKNFKRAVSGANEIEVAAKKPEINGAGSTEKPEAPAPSDKAG